MALAVSSGFAQLPPSLLPADPHAWVPAPEASSSPLVHPQEGAQVFECPFPVGVERQVWDLKTRLDLHATHGLEFIYTCENPQAIRAITWYVKSGDDWFTALLPVSGGRQRQWIPLSAFEPLGKPVGWKLVNGFRLSPWSAQQGPGRILLHAVRARRAEVAIIRPDDSAPSADERAYGERLAEGFGTQFNQLALPYAVLRDSNLAKADLSAFKLLILPYNPQPPAAALKALRLFVEQGGKLLVFYSTQPDLAALLGIKPGRYVAADRPGRWQGLAVDEEPGWLGPRHIHQTETANLMTAEPASPETRVLAWWTDAQGQRQAEAACLVSPQGAWFTHILTTEDEAAKQRWLAALLDLFVPGTFQAAAAEKVEQAIAAGGDRSADQALRAQAGEALAGDQPATAWDAAMELANARAREAAKQWPPAAAARRGIWDHSGRGLYAGDWPRTAGELAEAGLTDVFIYVPRSAARPSAAAQACKAKGLRPHLWHICWNLDGEPAERVRELEKTGRLQRSPDGQTIPWLCPSQPRNRESELDRLEQLAGTPGAAGLHLDYIRYPDDQHCYCPACRRAFSETTGTKPGDWPATVITGPLAPGFRAWRADQQSALVRETAGRIRAKFPGLEISAAVWPDYPKVIDQLGQDWGKWLKQGWLDFACPMNYTENAGEQAGWTARQTALEGAQGKILAGIGVTSSESTLDPVQTLQQIHEAVQAGAHGFVLFDLNHTLRRELFPLLRAP